jgi:hypothetical protein
VSKATARYVLKQANTKGDIDHIVDVIWAANYTPYDPIVQVIFPVLGYAPADREASLAEAKHRLWTQHLADPSSNWFYVVESESGNVVGSCQWQIFTTNPFPEGKTKLQAPWWPDGECRDFCELILNQVYVPRACWMRKPFLGECLEFPLWTPLRKRSILLTYTSTELDGCPAQPPKTWYWFSSYVCWHQSCRYPQFGMLDGSIQHGEASI